MLGYGEEAGGVTKDGEQGERFPPDFFTFAVATTALLCCLQGPPTVQMWAVGTALVGRPLVETSPRSAPVEPTQSAQCSAAVGIDGRDPCYIQLMLLRK